MPDSVTIKMEQDMLIAKARRRHAEATGENVRDMEKMLEQGTEKLTEALIELGPLLYEAILAWGWEFHFDLLQEECAEAIVAVSHMKRGRVGREKVMEEAGDVIISALAISLYDRTSFEESLKRKLKRLVERIAVNQRERR